MSAGNTAPALFARASDDFAAKLAHTTALLTTAAEEHGPRAVQATSLGAEDMVLTDLIARNRWPIEVATLDTGLLHPPTRELLARIQTHYGLGVSVFEPAREAVLHFVARHGERAMYDSVALRKACCGVRKLEPLARMLQGKSAWITGLRREQSGQRAAVPFSERDAPGRIKLNPLADWSWGDVWHYIGLHAVPYNALHDAFFLSIGCAPCTRAVALGEDFRAGRWWWESETAKECGLHVKESRPSALKDLQGAAA